MEHWEIWSDHNRVVHDVKRCTYAYSKTFLWEDILMAAGILHMMCLHLQDEDLKGAAIEMPFYFYPYDNLSSTSFGADQVASRTRI